MLTIDQETPSKLSVSGLYHYVSLLLITSMLTGCVVGPDYEKPSLSLPEKWSSTDKRSAKAPQLHEWWKRLNDPVLDDLVVKAVQDNLDVAVAKAKIREARATTREQVGGLFPTVSSSTSATRARTAASTDQNAATSSQFQTGFDSSWELDLFGKNRRGVEAARFGEQATEQALQDTLVTLIGDVAAYYVQAREYQELADLAERSSRSQRQTVELTKELLKEGYATMGDVTKAQAQAAYTEADIPSYKISYAQSVHRVSVLTGQPPSALDAIFGKKHKIPSPPASTSTGIPADLLVNRPDVREAERELAQYTARIGQAQANRYPSISLSGSIDTSGASLSDIGRKSTIGWSIGPSINIPLFQGGKLQAAVDVAKAQRDQYYFAYQSAVLSAMEDVQNAIVAVNQSRLRQSKLATSVQRYRHTMEVSTELNKNGDSDLFSLLDTERSLYSVEEDLIETRSDVATYYISLNKALGGGWSDEIDSSKPAVTDVREGPHLASTR